MKKGLSILLVAAALFGFYGGAVNLNDVLDCKDYWEKAGEESTANMNKLEDGLNQLKENEQAYLDGKEQVAQGEKDLAAGEATLAEGEKTLADGEAQYAQGLADYEAAPAKLAAGEAKLAEGYKSRDNLFKLSTVLIPLKSMALPQQADMMFTGMMLSATKFPILSLWIWQQVRKQATALDLSRLAVLSHRHWLQAKTM
jgi:hypothetical protein